MSTAVARCAGKQENLPSCFRQIQTPKLVTPALAIEINIGPDGEDSGAQLDGVHLHSAAGFHFRIKPPPESDDHVHKFLIECATIEPARGRVYSERVRVSAAALPPT